MELPVTASQTSEKLLNQQNQIGPSESVLFHHQRQILKLLGTHIQLLEGPAGSKSHKVIISLTSLLSVMYANIHNQGAAEL